MYSQIASTPKVKGRVAREIRNEMTKKPTARAKRNAQILVAKYSKLVK